MPSTDHSRSSVVRSSGTARKSIVSSSKRQSPSATTDEAGNWVGSHDESNESFASNW